jgi:hypothetical protein
LLAASAVSSWAAPFEGGKFKGRSAWSGDGNYNDPDDWIASPIALAIFAEAGFRNKLAHFDYNSYLPASDSEWEKDHAESVNGAVAQYGYDAARFFDCRKNLEGALASLSKAINKSSASDPLFLIIAGPMEVPARALKRSEPGKRPFVYCISHSRWNDGYDSKSKFSFTKRNVIEQDVCWIQIPDQNKRLSFGRFGTAAAPEEFEPYFWLRDSHDEKLRFLWERMLSSTRPDPSDAGMAWFLITGDELCDPLKIRQLLEDHRVPVPVSARTKIRLEAENFRTLEGCAVEMSESGAASQGLKVRVSPGAGSAILRTTFNELFAKAGHYDVEIRFRAEKSAQFALSVNDQPRGSCQGSASEWTSQIIRDVEVRLGDQLSLEVKGSSCTVDYVQLNAL